MFPIVSTSAKNSLFSLTSLIQLFYGDSLLTYLPLKNRSKPSFPKHFTELLGCYFQLLKCEPSSQAWYFSEIVLIISALISLPEDHRDNDDHN